MCYNHYTYIYSYVGNSDYNSLGMRNVIILSLRRTFLFNVSIIDDSTLERNETFTLDIIAGSLPSGVSLSSPGMTTVNILDDDGELLVWL